MFHKSSAALGLAALTLLGGAGFANAAQLADDGFGAAAGTSPIPQTQEIVVLGSSVAAGAGASPTSEAWGYKVEDLMENHAPIVPGSNVAWQVNNASVGGDNTTRVLARYQTDVVNAHPGTDIVIIALSLANEGLPGSGNPQAVYDSFKNGLTQIIANCRSNGYYPVISLVYPNGAYTPNEYAYVKRMNLLLNTWNVPSINFLGAIDDGLGHWAAGNFTDGGHPNNPGHGEMFYTVVPTLFEAIAAGKTTGPQIQGTNGYLRMQRDATETSPIRFTPLHPMHSFTISFRVRSSDVGTIAAVGAGATRATLEIRDSSLVYIGPTGAELSAPLDANDGHWHDIALSHRHATGQSLLFVDGVLKGTVSDQYIPDLFVLDGAAGAVGRALAPLQADFQDLCIYRAAWTQDEAMAQCKGALQQASLEICAPLADATPVSGAAFENRAQSMSLMTLNTSNFTTQLATTAPDGLVATSNSAATVNLTWTSHGTSGFTIERRRTGVAESWVTAGTSPANTPAFTDTGLLAGTSYDYRVSTHVGTLQSDYSNVVSVVTSQVVPLGGLIWDPDTVIAGAQDGSGTWDAATTANWYNGSTNQAWGNPTNPPIIAQFGAGGTSGTVTLSGTLNVGGLYFTQSGYSISSGTLNITPGAGIPFVYSTNGGTSSVNSPVLYPTANTQIRKIGPGTLILGNAGAGTTTEGFYTVTGGTFNSTTGIFDSILSMVAGNRLGTGGNQATPQVTLDAGTIQFTQTGNNNLANTRGLLVTALGGSIVDGGGGSFLPSQITNNAGAGSSLYLSNVTGTTQFQGIISGTGGVTWYGAGTASMQAVNTYSGGTTIKAGILSVTQSNGIGSGSLTFAGNATLQAGAATVSLANAITLGATSDVFDTNGNTLTLSGAISNSAATDNAMKVAGTGTLVLSGTLNLTGNATDTNNPALMMGNRNGATLNRGTVTLTGTGSVSRISTGWDNTANTFNFASTGTVTMATDFVSGQSANGVGVLNFTSGTLNLQNLNMANWDGSYGAFIMTGGTMNTTNLRNGGNGNGNGNSYSLMTGGVINVSTTTTIGRNGNGTNVLQIKGANTQFNVGSNRLNVGFSGDSTGVVTVDNGLLTVASNLSLAEGNTSSTFGILNLNGGIVRPNGIVAPNAAGNSIVNFNGGTLQARIANPSFMIGLTAANIFSGGATVDSNSLAITIGQILQGASGNGISGIPVATGGAGYLAPPVVKITGGGGTGATAVATLIGGAVNGIQITSAGTGYTSVPTVTLVGGGATTAATLGAISTAANATDGGLTKTGVGTLTLSGANTYVGGTTINTGVLATNNLQANGTASNIGKGTVITLNGGTLRYTGSSINNGFNRTITVGANGGTVDTAINGFVVHNGGFAGAGPLSFVDSALHSGQWLVTSGSVGFSGNVFVGNGTVGSGMVQYRSNNPAPFGTGVIQVNGGGIFTADHGATTPNILANNFILNGGTLGTQQPDMTYTGTFSLLANSTVGHPYGGTVGAVTLSGVISGGSGTSLSISTATSVTLTNTNTFTGPTHVTAGRLQVNGSLAAASAVTVSAGATLAGTGTISGPVTTLGTTSVIAPGAGSIGTLNTGDTVLTGILAAELNASGSDILNVTGNLDVTGATVTFTTLAAPVAASYVIAKYTGTLTGTLSSNNLPAGYNLIHDTAAKEIQLSKPVGFSAVTDGYPSLGATEKLPDADPDGDGIANLVEYALAGFDPTVANAAPGSLAVGVISFTKRATAVANGDLTYGIEKSATLGVPPSPWTAVVPDVNDSTTISFTLPTGQPKEFVRLQIVLN